MTNYARVVNDVAVDVSKTPNLEFHPTVAAQFILVPDTVKAGWFLNAGIWTAPVPVVEVPDPDPTPDPDPDPTPDPDPEPEPTDLRITKLAFLQRFTLAERLGIRAKRIEDPIVDDFLIMIDSATYIDLARDDTEQGLGYLMSKGLLTVDRMGVILNTPVKSLERPEKK